jgi:uncharacterized protein (TIGR02001 family)
MKTSKVNFWVAKGKLSGRLMLAALTVPGIVLSADAAFASDFIITGNVGFTSDYVFNGISQSFRSPALQGGFDYIRASGVYVGTWASSISGNQYTNASLEWDVYGGFNGKVTEDFGYNAGAIAVFYPGGKTNPAGPANKWDTVELVAGCTWNGLNLKYTYALTDWYGISSASGGGFEPTMRATGATTADGAGRLSSKGSGYIEANYVLEIGEGLTVTGHAGHQKIKNFSKLNYTDYKLALNKVYAGFYLGAAYTRTNATDNTLYHVVGITGDDKKLSGGIFALSAGRSF